MASSTWCFFLMMENPSYMSFLVTPKEILKHFLFFQHHLIFSRMLPSYIFGSCWTWLTKLIKLGDVVVFVSTAAGPSQNNDDMKQMRRWKQLAMPSKRHWRASPLAKAHICERKMFLSTFSDWRFSWNMWMIFSRNIGNFIIPTFTLIFFRGVGILPTTTQFSSFCWQLMSWKWIAI